MEDRSISTLPAEMPLPPSDGPASAAAAGPLGDPRALTILTTEHWSLLSARSLVYNEAFARGGMFLAFLSATLVALGLVATATGFSDAFLTVAAVVLALDLFVGLASLGRISSASAEDIRFVQGMNRIRHAYHEMVPGLEPYFVTMHHDDVRSVLALYGPQIAGTLAGVLHGFTTTPGMLGVICAAVGGALAAVVATLLTHTASSAALVGAASFVALFVIQVAISQRRIAAFWRSLVSVFPRDADGAPRT
jgi:hypothetical protein